jgi:hypothetical protein
MPSVHDAEIRLAAGRQDIALKSERTGCARAHCVLCISQHEEEVSMADNLALKGWEDRTRINLTEKFEVQYWTRRLNVTATDLRLAIQRVGNAAKAVEDELAA